MPGKAVSGSAVGIVRNQRAVGRPNSFLRLWRMSRQDVGDCLLEEILPASCAKLRLMRQAPAEVDEIVFEQDRSCFKRSPHARAIDLGEDAVLQVNWRHLPHHHQCARPRRLWRRRVGRGRQDQSRTAVFVRSRVRRALGACWRSLRGTAKPPLRSSGGESRAAASRSSPNSSRR